MFNRINILTGVRVVFILFFLVGTLGSVPTDAGAEKAAQDCEPGTGWMWTPGPSEPEVAVQVQWELGQAGMPANVEARSYGETDSCGTFEPYGVDFTIQLSDPKTTDQKPHKQVADSVLSIVKKHGKPNLGNVHLRSAQGDVIPVETSSQTAVPSSVNTAPPMGGSITKKVYVVVYDPLLSDGQTLRQRMGWNDPAAIDQQTIDLFKRASNNRLSYTIVGATTKNAWPVLVDGFSYTESSYFEVWSNPDLHHEPQGVDYNKVIMDPEFDICGKLNRGEIDELWLWGAPWFGYYESTLAGPGGYYYNSPPVVGNNNCNRLMPIMGPSYERTADEAVHNFTHRAESTMMKVYGSWAENRTDNNWDQFGLVKLQSPDYSYSGCGSSHWPPNAEDAEYDYGHQSSTLSNCADFFNYPNLSDPQRVLQTVTCNDWGCNGLGYYEWWFNHFPSYQYCGADNMANDWWMYFANPASAITPSSTCPTNGRWISGYTGLPRTVLSYTDGFPKSRMTDSSGYYSLIVANRWSGTVTPARSGYTFSPVSRSYSNVRANQSNQNYSSQLIPTSWYVDAATGNDSNSCLAPAAPCHEIQAAINKAGAGDVVYVASGTYYRITNELPTVMRIVKSITISGGWNPDFSLQNSASIIDGQNIDNGILSETGNVIVENVIVQNAHSYNGGGIYIVNGNFTLKRSTLKNNIADSTGAGIFLDHGVLNVVNSTFSGNKAGYSGGAIYGSLDTGASMNVQNSTIVYNQSMADYGIGGGIGRQDGAYNITNTIIANNTAPAGSPDCNATLASASFNIIGDMTGCTITSGSSNLNADPLVDPNLTEVRQVHQLLQVSPAINAGTSSGCPATDQLGTARPQGSACDIGSVESLGDVVPPVVSSITRGSVNPTTSAVVQYNVTFSEPVTGVDAGDFRLTTTNLSGSSVQAVSGSDSSYVVTVNTGTAAQSATLRLDLVDNDSIRDLFANPLGGPGAGNGNFTSGEVYNILPAPSLTFSSVAANDGWILESGENTDLGGTLNSTTTTFDVGDDKANKQYVGFLHFDTSGLPDTAVITSVTLQVRKQGVTGTDPFTTHGTLLADIQKPYFGTTAGLMVSDFQASANLPSAASFNSNPVNNLYSAALNSTGYAYVNLTGTTQFRLRFTQDDNNNKRADSVKFYSGDGTAANRPQLIVQYYVP
jgi:predicted outer membrane repeat protein